jgi:hypothetical protein
MDGTGPQQPLSDSQLDRELESALGVDPSPEFLARVRTRVAAEPRMGLWRLAIRRWTFEPLAGVALAGIVFAVVVPNLMRSAKRSGPGVTVARHVDGPIREAVEELPPVARERVAVPGARQVEADVSTSAEAAAGKHVGLSKNAEGVHTLPLQLSPVLFSADERRALVALVSAVQEGRVPPVPAAAEPTGQHGELRELRIDPLVVDPLPQLARLEIGAF